MSTRDERGTGEGARHLEPSTQSLQMDRRGPLGDQDLILPERRVMHAWVWKRFSGTPRSTLGLPRVGGAPADRAASTGGVCAAWPGHSEAHDQIHMRLFLREPRQEQRGPYVVHEGSAAAIALGHGNEQSKRRKHYTIKVASLSEKHKEGAFAYKKVATKFEIAGALNKALPRGDFCRFRHCMGVT